MQSLDVREAFLDTFAAAGFRRSAGISLLQPTIKTSFLFSVGFVDVMSAIDGNAVEMDGAVAVQRCFRHFDTKRVADGRHLSFFEMAGALKCDDWRVADLAGPLMEFFLNVCGLPRERLHVTYFGGGDVAGELLPADEDARDAYLAAGIASENVWAGGHTTNIWFEGANSGTERSGVCGPHSEVFVDLEPRGSELTGGGPLVDPGRFLEVSNIVTITHRTRPGGDRGLHTLSRQLVESAVGMERLEMVMADGDSVYQGPKLRAVADVLLGHGAEVNGANKGVEALRIAVDHARALTHLMADGGRPGPKGRGHVVRVLFRRLLKAADVLRIDARVVFPKLAEAVAKVDKEINPNLQPEIAAIVEVFDQEAQRMQSRKAAAHG